MRQAAEWHHAYFSKQTQVTTTTTTKHTDPSYHHLVLLQRFVQLSLSLLQLGFSVIELFSKLRVGLFLKLDLAGVRHSQAAYPGRPSKQSTQTTSQL